ncbi:MAG: hypothetical protein H6733_13465 [Alphaproteobacteria bacterium]|nr:hypothetical protein [Alphaproteobacteria bacterium]
MPSFVRHVLAILLAPWAPSVAAWAGDAPAHDDAADVEAVAPHDASDHVTGPASADAVDTRTCDHEHPAVEDDAAMVSQEPQHLGTNCSYVTGLMLRRVLDRGEPVTLVASLRAAEDLDTEVAAPYVVGPEDYRVLANAVLDKVVAGLSSPDSSLEITGRTLTRQGVRYLAIERAFPATSPAPASP